MKQKLKIVLAVFLILVAIFLAVVAVQPDEFRVTRSLDMSVPVADAFTQVDDLHNWENWSPWAKLDPNVTNQFQGALRGTGAVFKWSGNDSVGEGSMRITESLPPNLVRIKLTFIRPFAGENDVEFSFKPEKEKTRVTWTMSGTNNFVGKAMCLFMNMDKMLGGQFEQGLNSMQTAAKKAAEKNEPASTTNPAEAESEN